MKLSDFKGEEALDVLADIIEPLTTILTDEEIQKLSKKKAPTIAYIQPMLKNNKKEIIQVLARLDNKTVDEYLAGLNLITLPAQVLELINDPEVQNLFHSQGQNNSKPSASSGPAMENTEAKGN